MDISISSPLGALQIRPEREDDAAFRFALYCESRADLTLLPPPVRDQVMDMQFRAQTLSYRTQYPQARFDIVEQGGVPVGRTVRDYTGGVLHLVDILLAAQKRGGGAGSAILRAFMDEAAAGGMPMRLSVAAGNPAAQLYLRLGFKPVSEDGINTTMEWQAS